MPCPIDDHRAASRHDAGDVDSPVPESRTRGPHPWRLNVADSLDITSSDAGTTLVLECPIFDSAGRANGTMREVIDFAGTGLTPSVRFALAGYVLLGKLSPADVRDLIDEVRAAGMGRDPSGLSGLFDALGRNSRASLDDPMDGVLTGPLQRALVGRGTSLLDALEHLCGRRDSADVLTYFDVFVRFRCRILALALRLAKELPPIPEEIVRDSSIELFAWWRQHGAREVVLEIEGEPFPIALPARLPGHIDRTVITTLRELLGSLRRDGERLAHPRRDFTAVPEDVANELLDGLAGLLVNGLCLDRAPHPREIETTLVPAGSLPTRARFAREVEISSAPFHDALGRFFAAPATRIDLERTGRTLLVWRTGTCPFALAGWAKADPRVRRPTFNTPHSTLNIPPARP